MSGSEKLPETQQAEAVLRKSEHYRAVAEAATDAIITIDSENTLLIVNPAAEKIFGYSTKEMIGRPLTKLVPEYVRLLHKAGPRDGNWRSVLVTHEEVNYDAGKIR